MSLQFLSKQLAECMASDRHALRRQIERLRQQSASKIDAAALQTLGARIEVSRARVAARRASIPPLTFPDLPVSDKKDEIAALIAQHQVVIVCGETGSGKTTQLPKICLAAGRGVYGYIGHTQPRRIAARSVAQRIAEELATPLGTTVGYKVRFHDHTHPDSLIKLMTDGIVLAEIQSDPYLRQYDTLIIDEAHERSLNIDFLLGYCKWLLPKRRDLKLIITSATIDPERFSQHFDGAPIIEVSGRTYPVEIRYRPPRVTEEDEDDETTGDLQQSILDAVDELHRDMPGDILIFLSGENEIRETAESLRKHHPQKCEILPLYSKLSASEQEKIFKPSGKRRIVLATNVAETSLTVPGIRSVIDTGHARISRYSARSKIQRLPIEKISQASANQRAGRCGRVAEGICIRLYDEEDFRARQEFTEPEILRTNLAAVILQMKAMRLGDIEQFPFIEPPDSKLIRDGLAMLFEIQAIDKQGDLTDLGRRLLKLPIDPRLGRMLLEAERWHCLEEVTIIVAGLSIQDPREKPAEQMAAAEAKHALFRAEDSDFLSLINLWRVFETQKKQLSHNKLRQYCREHFLSYVRMREWHDLHGQLLQILKGDLQCRFNNAPAGYAEIHRALLTGLLSNIGFRHEQYEYLGARNVKFYIFPGSGQHKARPKWLMAAEQVETSKVYARTVAKIEPEWIEEAAAHLVKRSHYDPHWEKKAGRAAVHERTTLYGLTLQTGRKVPYEHVDPAAAREMFIRHALVEQEYHSNAPFFRANRQLLEEVGYLEHKGRRADLLVDAEWLYRFYAAKIPEHVTNGALFEQWRKSAERVNPRLLFLTREDLTQQQEHLIDERRFPDQLKIGALIIPLQYRFEPGHEEDGVTALIPVHQLNQLSPESFEWLVPGLLAEKLTHLLKGLPKQLRKLFVPVPQTVERCLASEPEAHGSLYEWLGQRLRQLTGESVPLTAWQDAGQNLPPHLRMNYRILDDQGQLIDFGRDLIALQRKHHRDAGRSFEQLAEEALYHTGCIQWAFEDLPENMQLLREGQSFVGFPAVVDEGETVGVRLFDTRDKAHIAHRAGLTRLFQLALRKEYKYLAKQLPDVAQARLIYQNLPPHPVCAAQQDGDSDYVADLLRLIFETVFVGDATLRRQTDFEARLQQRQRVLVGEATTIATRVAQILRSHADIKRQLDPLPHHPALQDMRRQIDHLLFRGFIAQTPREAIDAYPRYLQALQHRLSKALQEPTKDQQKMLEISRFEQRYWKSVVERSKNAHVEPQREAFRWMLEEFRVSLFAQQLKTAYPVSATRLEKAWAEVT